MASCRGLKISLRIDPTIRVKLTFNEMQRTVSYTKKNLTVAIKGTIAIAMMNRVVKPNCMNLFFSVGAASLSIQTD